jgi:hypothetical protein
MKQIDLRNSGIALVDDDDYEYLSKSKWYLSKGGYAIHGEASNGIKPFAKMHRIIMNINDCKIKIDHINGIKTDNRKENLRIATLAQNVHNSCKRINTKNNYKGTQYIKRLNLWQSRCRMNGEDYYLGVYKTEIAAAYSYNKKALELSSYSRINYLPFPEDYLQAILITDRIENVAPERSKYKYIYFKKKTGRMRSDKWYVRFVLNKNVIRKGNFFTEREAIDYLKNNYSDVLSDIESFK